jgi:beta-carotene/zeaxanthin 4-ketolase
LVGSDTLFPHFVGTKPAPQQGIASGLLIALSIISLWAVSLVVLLRLNINELPVWLIPILMLWQMFLYTGLFITAHDAMHGSVCPQNPKLNHLIGSFAVFCYATLPRSFEKTSVASSLSG